MPSLLECFTATYPEAMRMERPIVTTDLAFAQGLCGEAAFLTVLLILNQQRRHYIESLQINRLQNGL